jgi:predicted transcriptional regulator of viral defense system
MRDEGTLRRLDRGLYILPDAFQPSNPDLIVVARRVPRGVICLLSALAIHEVTTQLPQAVHIALPRGTKTPRLHHPVLRVFRFSEPSFGAGVEERRSDGSKIRIYSLAKTVADCFKFRNQIGLDVALEALWECWSKRRCTMDDLWKYARVCRVANVMRPYLEFLVLPASPQAVRAGGPSPRPLSRVFRARRVTRLNDEKERLQEMTAVRGR